MLLIAARVCGAAPWYIQTVDDRSYVGGHTSMALDADGHPHVAYVELDVGLKYAAWNGARWHIQTVDTGDELGYDCCLALDADGRPHVSYWDGANGDLKYAAWNGRTWDIQRVDSGGEYTSLALDTNGNPRISHYDDRLPNRGLRYAAWNGSAWDLRTVHAGGADVIFGVGWYTSLALGADGNPRISYHENYDWVDGDLKYARWNGASWDIQTVDAPGWVGTHTSLVLDAKGYARIAYSDESNHDLKYAAWDGAGWVIQTVDRAGDVGDYASLALDAADQPHIAYLDRTNSDLRYAAWSGTNWAIETVDSPGALGYSASLALDVDGEPHITDYDKSYASNVRCVTTRAPAEASHELPATGYYMISFPLTPTLATPDDLLSDDLGDGDYYMWGWESGGYQAVPTSTPGSQTATLSAQQGYWILTPAATLDIDVGGTLPHGDQTIPLQAGWNMVGAPYEAPMDSVQVDNGIEVNSLADAESAGWVLATFYTSHDGTGSYNTITIGQMPPDALCLWYGYWVLAGLDCSLVVPQPSGGAGGTAVSKSRGAATDRAWAFDIRASSGSRGDSITIAAADQGSDGFDGFALDRPKPPAPPGEGRLRMVLRGKGRRGKASPPYNKAPGRQMLWASELAAETKGTAEDAAEWEFTVTGGIKGESVTLSWPELSRLPKERVSILTDRDTAKRTFMRSRAQYEFAAPGEGTTRSFAVTVRPAGQGALLISGLSAVPARGGVWDIGFNLSADAAVSARVYNVAGRLVAEIARGHQLASGRAAFTWDGRGTAATHVPGGTYLLRVTARAEDGEQASAVALLQAER